MYGDNGIQKDRLAWERAYAKGQFLRQPIHPELEHVVNQFEEQALHQVLDLGCGSGRHTVFMAQKGFTVSGLDLAPSGVSATRQQLAGLGLMAHLVLSDIQWLPYRSGVFDAIVSVQVIHHDRIKGIQNTVSEMWRVLAPEGLVWVTVPVPQRHPSKRGREIEPRTFVPLEGCEKGLPHHLFTEKELDILFHRFMILDLHIHANRHYSLLVKKPK